LKKRFNAFLKMKIELNTSKSLMKDHPLAIELNIAKFSSFIFAPSHSVALSKPRVKNWVAENGNEKVLARILVHTVDNTSLTTFDFKTWLALQKLWYEGKRTKSGAICLSLREVVRIMDISWGSDTPIQIKNSLRRLRTIPITWQFSFFDNESKKYVQFEEPITLLEELRLWMIGQETEESKSYFRINKYIDQNLSRNHTKPVLLEIAMGIRGELALLLYTFLDIVMADKWKWERRISELLKEDLNIQGKYHWPADRKRLVERAIKQINTLPLSTGRIILDIQKTVDGTEYKLVAHKEPMYIQTEYKLNLMQKDLISQILEVTRDEHSRRFYETVVSKYPESTIYRVLSETRDAQHRGKIKETSGKFFTSTLKRMAAEGNLKI
jgi:hypothetical protein